jgi:hypothetical protein
VLNLIAILDISSRIKSSFMNLKYFGSFNLVFILFLLAVLSCDPTAVNEVHPLEEIEGPLFENISEDLSGIAFNNILIENEFFNNLNYDVLYNGGGVAVGDINNDGLVDIYFCGNQSKDALYINKGNFKFEDISDSAGISEFDYWSTSASMVDINEDGYLDIYITKYLLPDEEKRRNLLLINNKDNTFTEKGKEFGIDDSGFSTSANFFDYNKDGLIDLYVGNQFNPSEYYRKLEKGKINYNYTDHLYKNVGNNKFIDVTESAGIKNYAAALSVTTADLNQDGWPDIYVTNDYEEPDFVYYNNGQGGFAEMGKATLKHMSNFSMGADIGDINNDGLVDIFVADMVAQDNFRVKTNMSGMNPAKFWGLVDAGYHHQYMFNTLQLNNGGGVFSDLAQMAGVSNTDWSWSPLLVDFDLDGYKDLFITNGLMRDIRNNDHRIFLKEETKSVNEKYSASKDKLNAKLLELSKMAPSKKLPNYMYYNTGDLTFEDVSEKWNLALDGWSHGSAVADFDNDGDLDLVINNLNDAASIYKNKAVENGRNYIGIEVSPYNMSLGTQVVLELEDGSKIHDHIHPVRGYMSQSDARLRIGFGNKKIEKISVFFPNGKMISKTDVSSNQIYKFNALNATETGTYTQQPKTLAQRINMPISHEENYFDDYEREILLPYKLSSLGPCMAIADINGDGLDDLYVGGSTGRSGATFYQNQNNGLELQPNSVFDADKQNEDVSAVFVDIDGDNDQDLIVASGGNENNLENYRDRLYINDGKGSFSKGEIESPSISSGEISLGDADGDGDMDVFIAGRQIPGEYGSDVSSTLYINEGGKLINKTEALIPDLIDIGMLTDGIWDDIDEDGDNDLIVVGEWTPIFIFTNDNGIFSKSDLPNSEGWWNAIHKNDIDHDGDLDLFVGNLGTNIKYKASEEAPFKLFAKDFDGSGTHDVYLGYYEDGVCYPVRGRQCSSQQMPFVKDKYKKYENFATASIEDVLSGMTEGASIKEAKIFENVWLENDGGKYILHKLPNIAQISPVYTFTDIDLDGDGKYEVFAAGNFHDREVETTRSDAGTGFIMKYENGKINIIQSKDSGIYADGDVRESGILRLQNGTQILITANNNAVFGGWVY